MFKKRGTLILVFAIILVLTAANIRAVEYYADVVVDVNPEGTISISGTSNHPQLIMQAADNYTSKKGSYWLLDIHLDGLFSDFVFKVILPENAIINYVKAPSQVRIGQEGKRLTITGTGHHEDFAVAVQYSFDMASQKSIVTELLYWFGPLFLIIGLGLLLFFLGSREKAKLQPKSGYNPDTLTDRQRQILDMILNSNSFVTQAMVERTMKIPKSSISRNIDALVRLGIIRKEKRGMSNILILDK